MLELCLELGHAAVLQLGHFLPVALAARFFHLQAHALDFFLDLLAALHAGFLGFPDFLKVGILALEPADLFLDQLQALLRSLVFFLFHRLALDLQLDQATVELVHDLGFGVDLDFDLRRGFVDQVDGLVRQESIGDVAVRQLGRGDDRRVGNVDAVVNFIFFLQAAQDSNGGLDAGFVDEDLLEATFERGILFDVLAVFVERGRADAVQLATRQRGLEHVAGIHRAFGLAGADHRVNLVNEQDGLAFVLSELFQHGLQALFELAAVLGAGQQRSHVERQHALALQAVRHFAVDDALR